MNGHNTDRIVLVMQMFLAGVVVLLSGCVSSKSIVDEDEQPYFVPLDTLPKLVVRQNKDVERIEAESNARQFVIDSLRQINQKLKDAVVSLENKPVPTPMLFMPPEPPRPQPRTTELVFDHGKLIIVEGIQFEPGKAKLKKGYEPLLKKAFFALIANADAQVEIAAYTDSVGDPDKNEKLSLQRARAVHDWLTKKGIDPRRLTVKGMGPRDPLSLDDTPEERARNQRIEFHVK